MNMHTRFSPAPLKRGIPVLLLAPATVHAQGSQSIANQLRVEMNLASFLIIGALLLLSISMFFIFQRRFNKTNRELKDVSEELSTTRDRLTDTGRTLDQTRGELKDTAELYQGILFDAQVGMFQMDADGECTYINSALQEMSGLYPKKAMKEGIECAIHPEDLEHYKEAWLEFTEGDGELNVSFRFQPSRKEETHVICRASKVLNSHNEAESYIGWISNVSDFHEEELQLKAETARYEYFVNETIEGCFQLTPEKPIPLSTAATKLPELIMDKMAITSCNGTFASIYGVKPAELIGLSICELQGGCGPFRNTDTVAAFIEDGFKSIDLESVRQDINGNRLNLLNNVVGIVEDNQLVGIWGSHRNISQQKREKVELTSQVKFMKRILGALPADVQVKDTRCRYMYASKKLADRTGIPQEEWLGKTIFEVMPGTPREHDQLAIETMKSGRLSRVERPYEARGKTGWMETVQIPLVSEEGLVEGVVGLSLDISDRKQKEEEFRHYRNELETHLKHTTSELRSSRSEHSKTADELSDAIQKLKISESEKANREHSYNERLAERKLAEDNLRRNESALLTRQQQLEEQLANRLNELDAETDKRRKWEELLSIKEDELRKIEEHAAKLGTQLSQQTELGSKAQADLETTRSDLVKQQAEVDRLKAERDRELESLNAEHTEKLNRENSGRIQAEKQLTKSKILLTKTQQELKRLTEKHAKELEHEVSERKAAAERLVKNMEELGQLKQQFSQRIDEQTKSIKQELAKKQIREKALRKHEKDLEGRIRELEGAMQLKAKEFAEQIEAREGAEEERQQVEQKLEQLSKRQQDLIAHETQKLSLNIAEIRLDEIKWRKKVGDLQQEKNQLEDQLKLRTGELQSAEAEHRTLTADLSATREKLKQTTEHQAELLAGKTRELQEKIQTLETTCKELREQLEALEQEKENLSGNLQERTSEQGRLAQEYKKLAEAYKTSQSRLQELNENKKQLIESATEELREKIALLQQSERELRDVEENQADRIQKLEERIQERTEQLKEEESKRHAVQHDLDELNIAFSASQDNAGALVEQQTETLREQNENYRESERALKQVVIDLQKNIDEHEAALKEARILRNQSEQEAAQTGELLEKLQREQKLELRRALADAETISRMNVGLVDELNTAVRTKLDPVVRTALLVEQAENITSRQQQDMQDININCRSLIDMMNYRSELTHVADGGADLEIAKCDLHETIKHLEQQFSHRAETKRLFFAVSFAQYQTANNVPKMIETDEDKVHKILSILLGYALEKTEKGRLGLHATRSSGNEDIANIVFELAYTGIERRDSLLTTIFGTADLPPEDGAMENKFGLALARRYADMLQAKIQLAYRDAGVTALTVEFPFKRAASEVLIQAQAEAAEKEKAAGAA